MLTGGRRQGAKRMYIPRANCPPLLRDNLELAFTNQGVPNTSLQVTSPSPSSPHTHTYPSQDATLSSLTSSLPFNQHSKQASVPHSGWHSTNSVRSQGFAKAAVSGAEKAYLLTHYVDSFFVLGILLGQWVRSTRDAIYLINTFISLDSD